MDIDLFRDGEQFSTFESHNFLYPYPDDSTSTETIDSMNFTGNNMYKWELENERELNGDLGLIPSTNNYCVDKMSESPPAKDDFQKIMNDWQQLIGMDSGCEDFHIEDPIIIPEEIEPVEEKHSPLHEILNLSDDHKFDITTYINDEEAQPVPNLSDRKVRAGVKKMDLKAQRYIIEEDEGDVDVETVSECENSPVLEAGDLNSLLEQFEATQVPQHPPENIFKCETEENDIKKEPIDTFTEYKDKSNIKCKPEIVKVKKEKVEKDVVKIKMEPEVNNSEKEPEINVCDIKDEQKDWQTKKNKKKVETQSESCLVKNEEPKTVILDVKDVKIEQAKPLVIQKEEPVPQTAKITTTTNQIKPQNAKEQDHNVRPQKTFKHETHPLQQETTPPPLSPAVNRTESTTSSTLNSIKTASDPLKAAPSTTKNKQIIDALPPELIARIKESGKRKTISVIPPIPNKKRSGPRTLEVGTQPNLNKIVKSVSSESVQLDHDYCSNGSYPDHLKKDSGFESAEEDERTIIGKQPMVKNADGKLMVSLLKVNTIHIAESCQKKKLNLEEYKKRRNAFVKSHGDSRNCSPLGSSGSSPLLEDENTKRIKHQEKLMKMAMEVLNTPPKSEKKPEAPPEAVVLAPQPVQTPPDMEKKTLVSIGVNTDFKICKNMDPVAPVEQLEEIKPLLKKANINCNSLITSVIENIPKAMNQSDSHVLKRREVGKLEHGEDKTIVYLPKIRAPKKTISTEVQTNISLIQQCKQSRYRRRRNSSSSSSSSSASRKNDSSTRYKRARKDSSSGSSRWSRSSGSDSYSSYSSRSSSGSRSRSSSPRYSRKDREHLREVEERRVIYVGRISSSTTRDDLRKRFQKFGPITNISLHFRDHGDNYGFVTFANKLDAYEAIEHGNDDLYHPKYDLSFGGRRIFCKTSYSDLDNVRDETDYFAPRVIEDSFDTLLREAQEKLRKRKA